MRIAQVAPLYESVPPRGYGGTERIVSYLTEELVERGHDVTLFASQDSETRARLAPAPTTSIRQREDVLLPDIYHCLLMEAVFDEAEQFDILHFHTNHLHFPYLKYHDVSHVTTLHGRLDLQDLIPLFSAFPKVPIVSISDAQRAPLSWLNWMDTVHHGLPESLYSFQEEPDSYLVFVGRISPEKRLDRAIEIARRSGLSLKIGAKVDKADDEYFEREIAHLLDDPLVEFIGEVDEQQKCELLGQARALLFPIDWPEPFGLVMIEAFACGTPVIAYPHGSVPEVMQEGTSGWIVDSLDAAVEAVEKSASFERARCRTYFEEHFSVGRMCDNYLRVYEEVRQLRRRPTLVSTTGGNGHSIRSAGLSG